MRAVQWIVVILATLSLCACAQTKQAGSVKDSGFLKDYSRLKPGKSGEALERYENPNAHFAKYNQVVIDPITIWAVPKSAMGKIPQEEQEALATHFHQAVAKQLEKDYQIVQSSGPDTMRLRLALTNADQSEVAGDVITTFIPQLHMLSNITSLATGTEWFVGEASAEGQLTDSQSGEILLEAVDRRVGQKAFKGVTNSWGDVEAAFNAWAEMLFKNLKEERMEDAQ